MSIKYSADFMLNTIQDLVGGLIYSDPQFSTTISDFVTLKERLNHKYRVSTKTVHTFVF